MLHKRLSERLNIWNSRKGFTLVEVIVVLIILAILAGILVASLSTYIDKANDKTIIAETRYAVMATQTLLSEGYGTGKTVVGNEAAQALAQVGGTINYIETDADKAVLSHLGYTDGSRFCAYCAAGGCSDCDAEAHYTVTKDNPGYFGTVLLRKFKELGEQDFFNNKNMNEWIEGDLVRTMDSTAPYSTNTPYAESVKTWMKDNFIMADVGDWSIQRNFSSGPTKFDVIFTSTKIKDIEQGQWVKVTKYDLSGSEEQILTGYMKVVEKTSYGKKYNVLENRNFKTLEELPEDAVLAPGQQ